MAQSQGINTILEGNAGIIREYNTKRGGHLRTIQSVSVTKSDDERSIRPVLAAAMDHYWSVTPKGLREPFCWYDDPGGNSYSGRSGDHNRFHDNIWCLDPEKMIEIMREVEVPWTASKVLAAGAIHPKQGFGFAFRKGADFVAVGMLDFQVRENTALVKRYATRLKDRDRPWRA